MHYPDKAKAAAQTYFSSFARLFGETPNFPSGEERTAALQTIERIIDEGMHKYHDDPAMYHIIDIEVLDKMEELINTYK
ncbi:conserved hypothetical protein [Edwardsiella phage PEi26]|uniref:Uncharacterized protein n=1 Tax=Edwardsiella phage PEi26 TaxID=1608311 RepID=A0A0B6VPC5_9CAUD|nr:conserved hypothetical protein [Edwardsiella phage PEi26]